MNVVPLAEYKILGDGNCLFRAFSAILTGSQVSYTKVRAEICRFIVVQGAGFISRYLETKFENVTPVQYMKKYQMDSDTTWGSDIEIIALSKMLSVDIFVSNQHSDVKKRNKCHSTWYRYCTDPHSYTDPALYMANRANHYQPVIDLIHSRQPSFYNTYTFSDSIVLE